LRKKSDNKPYRTGMAARVRAVVGQIRGSFSREEIIDSLDLWSREMNTFKTAMLDMVQRGELTKTGDDNYVYNPAAAPKTDVKNRICRAMHVKGAFCAADIKKLTEADLSYVHAVIRRMVKTGELEFTGYYDRVKRFRVRNGDKFYQKFIRGQRSEVRGQKK